MNKQTNNKINDWTISVATINGSGSQSSNTILIKTLFRMGIPVGGKNLFPSNIAGLPTWFSIRANSLGFTARQVENDLVLAMNVQTIKKDIDSVKENGVFIYNSDLKFDEILLRKDLINIGVPFRELVKPVTSSVKLRKLLTNMIYVGIVSEVLEMNQDLLNSVIADMFSNKPSVVESNILAVKAGIAYAKENDLRNKVNLKSETMDKNKNKILIDGNTAAGLGLVYGGCSFVSWYPITPSSSLVESYISFANKYRQDEKGKNTFAVVQAEDELAAITMVMGSAWTGARSMTATSGPGLSLMAESAGFSYFAELPSVLWNIQRVGPSTGLPTRVAQSDLLSAHYLSHGDTRHPVLIPGSPSECFEFGQTGFDLAERMQTFVVVLSDIDLGMNLFIDDQFKYPTKKFDHGKIADQKHLEKLETFHRYADTDGDGITYRTIPGTKDPKAAFLTRGSGHNEEAQYTEDNDTYVRLMNRLAKKYQTAKKYVPKPILSEEITSEIGIISYGSCDSAIKEAQYLLNQDGIPTNYLRLRALPFTYEVDQFLEKFKTVFVIEQNRDGQMKQILLSDYPQHWQKMHSLLHYDGLPIPAQFIRSEIKKNIKETH